MKTVSPEVLQRLLNRERTARKEAESLLEGKSRELYLANEKLILAARELEDRVNSRTVELEKERNNAISTALALQASERRFHDIAEVVGEYFWEMDTEFRFTELTKQASGILGYSLDELTGKTLFTFMEKSNAEQLRLIFTDFFTRRLPFKNIRLRSLHKDGRTIWQRISGAPILDSDGVLVGYRGAGLDITAEEQSKSSLEVLALALEYASEGVGIIDKNGYVTYLNSAYVKIYGYKNTGELLGKTWKIFYDEKELKRLEPLIEEQIERTGFFSGEAKGLRKDGSLFAEQFSLHPLPDGGLLRLCRDDTERQRVFMDLQAQSSLRSALLESIQTAVLFEDVKTGSSMINASLRKVFQLDEDEKQFLGLGSMGVFNLVKQQFIDGDRFLERTRTLMHERNSVINEEWQLIDGRILVRDYLKVNVGDEFRGHLWAFRDISEIKLQQRILEEARLAAEAGTRAKSIFLANMSHEIRTPLNGIIGMNRFLMAEPLNDTQLEYARSVDISAKSLLQIIDEILDFSKIEAGQLETEIVEFSLLQVLDEVMDLLLPRAIEKKISLDLIYDSRIPRKIRGDPSRLRQILLNLAGNAVKFTEEGDVCIRIKAVDLLDGTQQIDFRIEDSGIGMDKESLSKVFNSFSQADTSISRRFGGTGLGLTIASNLVKTMMGEIHVKSKLGSGTDIRLSLPFFMPEQDQDTSGNFKDLSIVSVLTSMQGRTSESIVSFLEVEDISIIKTNSIEEGWKACQDASVNSIVVWMVLIDSLPDQERLLSIDFEGRTGDSIRPLLLSQKQGEAKLSLSGSVSFLDLPVSRRAVLTEFSRLAGKTMDFFGDENLQLNLLKKISLSSMRILLAEDNRINQQVGRVILENMGAQVDIAVNGLEVLDLVNQHHYDLILMDVRMPIMDGLEACKKVREMGLDVPIVAVTADAMKGDREHFLANGMNGYLSKPLMEDKLASVLLDLFGMDLEQGLHMEEPEQSSEKVIDVEVNALIRILGGDKELAQVLLAEFKERSGEMISLAADSLKEGNREQARSIYHQLSGSAFSVQVLGFGESALNLERLLMKDLASTEELGKAQADMLSAFERFKIQESSIDWSKL